MTGLNINVHSFVLKGEREEVFKGFLKKGKREILFSSPCENLQVTSQDIKITESGINYAVLEVKKDAEYSITGQKHEDKSYKYSKENAKQSPTTKVNTKAYKTI